MAETYLDVEADVTPDMFVRARRRLIWWAVGRWLALATLAMIVAAGTVWLTAGPSFMSVLTTGFAAYGVFAVAYIAAVAPRSTRMKPTMTQGHFRFVARKEGYTVTGPFGEQHLKWSTFKMAWIDSTYLYLFLSNRGAQVLLLRLIPDPAPLINHLRSVGLLRPLPKMFFLF